MKGLNARIKGVHKSKEGMWEEAGIQNFFLLKVDRLIDTRMVKQNNNCYEYRIRSLKFWLLLKLYMRINIRISLEFYFYSGKKF